MAAPRRHQTEVEPPRLDEQQPPWVEHAFDPGHWDLAFPRYRRTYHYEFDPLIVELNHRLREPRDHAA